jgi:hypothetical protein
MIKKAFVKMFEHHWRSARMHGNVKRTFEPIRMHVRRCMLVGQFCHKTKPSAASFEVPDKMAKSTMNIRTRT